MDGARFDQLLHSLASGISRRATLGAAMSGLFATGAISLLEPDAEAKKHHKKKKKKKCKNCRECQVCQKGKCAAKQDGTTCSTGVCQGGVCGCPTDQTCEIADICCPAALEDFDGATFCDQGGGEFVLCSCPAGEDPCVGDQGGGQCCLPSDSCDPVNLCTGTCSAENDFCELEWAACGDGCACFTTASESQVCADLTNFVGCPETSECSSDGDCGTGVCVDVSCCAASGFVGVCLDECAVMRSGRTAKADHRGRHDRLRLQPFR